MALHSISDQREGGGYNHYEVIDEVTGSISDQREGGGYNI